MGKWCEVFKAGDHTDSAGRKRTWSTDDLDRLVSSYNPEAHEAPICIDHNEAGGPVIGGPAYGWVEALKREGDKVLARFKDVVPEFAEMVNKGLFKKRSISIYPDGSLRHVAWLGAKPPAIKGLKDFTFNDNEAELKGIFAYSELSANVMFQEVTPMPTVEELQAKLEAEKTARATAESKASKLETENKLLNAQFSEAQTAAKKAKIDSFIEDGIKAGKILPAWKEKGLAEFMMALESQTQEYQFNEADGKQTQLGFFQNFINSFSEHGLFKDMTANLKNKEAGKAADFSEDDKLVSRMAAAGNGKEAK